MIRLACIVRFAALAAALSIPLTAAAADDIVVGRSLTLTGPLGSYGIAKQDGQDAYLEKINREGGIRGRKLKAVTIDDGYVPAKMIENVRKLAAESKPVVFLGLFGVPTVAATLPVLPELKIPAVGASSGTAILRSQYHEWFFPVRASYADEARAVVTHMRTLGLSRVTIVQQENPFGEAVANTFAAEMKKQGLSYKELKIDLKGEQAQKVVEAMKLDPPQVAFLAMLAPPAIPMMREMSKDLAGVSSYSFSPVDGLVVLNQSQGAGRGLGISQIVPNPTNGAMTLSREYQRDVKLLQRGLPSYYGLEGYLEAVVFVEGLKRIPAKTPISPAALAKALETMESFDAGGVEIQYNSKAHRGADFVELTVVGTRGVQR